MKQIGHVDWTEQVVQLKWISKFFCNLSKLLCGFLCRFRARAGIETPFQTCSSLVARTWEKSLCEQKLQMYQNWKEKLNLENSSIRWYINTMNLITWAQDGHQRMFTMPFLIINLVHSYENSPESHADPGYHGLNTVGVGKYFSLYPSKFLLVAETLVI